MSSLHNQISGTHYKRCKIQPIEYIHANGLGFIEGNVVKYITRHRHKNGADDLRKIKHYIDILLDLEYGEKGDPANQPAPETVVCQDWHGAVREMRTGTPNSAMSAVIAPTPSTPGFLDKAAETLPDKSKPTIRTNGVAFAKHVGDRWQHWCGPTLGWCTAPEWCANAAPRWEVATDEQLKDAGCASN